MTVAENLSRPILSDPPTGFTALRERAQSYVAGYTGRSLRELIRSKLARHDIADLKQTSVMTLAERQQMMNMRDLTDPTVGSHAMQLLLDSLVNAVETRYGSKTEIRRAPIVLSENENYLRLGFDKSAVVRDARYAYRLDETRMLRSHLSATGPDLLHELARGTAGVDTTYVLPGIAYRRDTVDRYHAAALHQADFWHVRQGKQFNIADMRRLVAAVIESAVPGMRWRWNPTKHPYTTHGRQVDVWYDGRWVEVGECGILRKNFMAREGLDTNNWAGMLFGVGLDRLLMIRKQMPDIRLLRAESSLVADQLQTLDVWQPLRGESSTHTLTATVDVEHDADTLGDLARRSLGLMASYLENLEIENRTVQSGQAQVKLQITFSSLQGDLPEEIVDQALNTLQQGLTDQITYESHNVLSKNA